MLAADEFRRIPRSGLRGSPPRWGMLSHLRVLFSSDLESVFGGGCGGVFGLLSSLDGLPLGNLVWRQHPLFGTPGAPLAQSIHGLHSSVGPVCVDSW